MLSPVARLGDKIGHDDSSLGMLIGAAAGVIGAAVAIGIAAATCGIGLAVAVPIIAGSVVAGAAIGKWLGGGASDNITGEISKGASRTFVGPNIRAVARWNDPIECQDTIAAGNSWPAAIIAGGLATAVAQACGGHDGSFVSYGRWNVQVEGKLMSSLGSMTSCEGVVTKGIDGDAETKRTLVGGHLVSILKRSEMKGGNPAVEWGVFAIDWLGTLFGLRAAWKAGTLLGLPLIAGLLKVGNVWAEKELGERHWLTVTLGIASAITGERDATKAAKLSEAATDIFGARAARVLIPLEHGPKVDGLWEGPPGELEPVRQAQSMIDAERATLDEPAYVSWTGRWTQKR